MWLGPSVAASVSFVSCKAASNLCLSRLRERLLLPSSHRKSIAGTVCWSARLSASWIAFNPSSMPLLGCCATGENTITLHCSSVMFYTGSQFLFESNLRSAYWSTSHFMGPCLGICATIVRRRIHPLRVYDFDRRINAIFLQDGGRLGLVTAPSQLLALNDFLDLFYKFPCNFIADSIPLLIFTIFFFLIHM